jgi:chorismate mutase
MRLYALRGATQLECDDETQMLEKVETLMKALFEKNKIVPEQVVSIHFTLTDDLHSMNPATAYRRRCESHDIPLFCSQEPTIINMLPMVVRVMIHLYRESSEERLVHQYLEGTNMLRPDLSR